MSRVVLRADSICRRFGSRHVLTSASLSAVAGRITVLLGRNGSGKSTLLRIAAGVIPADQGIIEFRGRVRLRPDIAALSRDGLFFLPERDLLARNLCVREHLELMARRCGVRSSVDEVAAGLSLTECGDRLPHELSGGERRRTELALIELRTPACLLADEPFTGLGPRDVELVAGRLRQFAARGCAVVVSGHEVTTLLDLADDIVWVTSGTTHQLGSPARAAAHWQFNREYLGRMIHNTASGTADSGAGGAPNAGER